MRRFVPLLSLIIVLVLASLPLLAQDEDNNDPDNPLQPFLQQAEDAARRAEEAALSAEATADEAGKSVDLALNLFGLFEAVTSVVGVVIPVLVVAGGFLGLRRLESAQRELAQARERFADDMKEQAEALENLRHELETSAATLRKELSDEARQTQNDLESREAEQRKKTADALRAQSLLPLAERQYRAQDYVGAINSYSRALELAPENPVIRYRLGYIYVQSGDLEKAEMHFNRARELEPDFAPALAGLGFVYRRIGEHEDEGLERDKHLNQAENFLLRALEISPKLVDDDGESWWGVLGGLYRRRGQIDQAIYAYRKATEVTPYSSYGFGNLAFLYLKRGERERMLKTYERVEKLAAAESLAEVDNYWGYADLIVSRMALGKYELANEVLPIALEVAPPDSPYMIQGLVDTLEELTTILEAEKLPHLQKMITDIKDYQTHGYRGDVGTIATKADELDLPDLTDS